MELVVQIGVRNAVLRANWLPRLQNEEADALTNLDFRHFKKENRIPIDLSKIRFGALDDLFAAGESYTAELEEARSRAKAAKSIEKDNARDPLTRKRLKAASDTLRERDPW